MKFQIFLSIAFGVICTVSAFTDNEYHFEDYLRNLEDSKIKITDDFEGSGSDEDINEFIKPSADFKLPLRTGLENNKDVSCCYIGHMAGDKGYHCVAKFYAARVMQRNQNRAHNRKLGFYGRFSVPHYGDKLMRTFEHCVATRVNVFQKCCHYAAEVKRSAHFDTMQRKRYSRWYERSMRMRSTSASF